MIRNGELIERFMRYVRIDTQSADEAEQVPSTAKQHVLAEMLYKELSEMGFGTYYDREHCYVYAEIPGEEPGIGFVAHMDTSPAASGENVKPRIVEKYDGGDILLSGEGENAIFLRTGDFPDLARQAGNDLIVTDGTTLLGADDKAGVAEIMRNTGTEPFPSHLHRMRRWETGRPFLIRNTSARGKPIRWTAADWANSNTSASTRPRPE